MIVVSKEADSLLKYVLCIYYLLYFKKDKGNVEALINFSSEVNAIALTYAIKLGFKI